ncbi:hypothetical protein FB446DRAFT_725349, partial [Lentinula raphanica]
MELVEPREQERRDGLVLVQIVVFFAGVDFREVSVDLGFCHSLFKMISAFEFPQSIIKRRLFITRQFRHSDQLLDFVWPQESKRVKVQIVADAQVDKLVLGNTGLLEKLVETLGGLGWGFLTDETGLANDGRVVGAFGLGFRGLHIDRINTPVCTRAHDGTQRRRFPSHVPLLVGRGHSMSSHIESDTEVTWTYAYRNGRKFEIFRDGRSALPSTSWTMRTVVPRPAIEIHLNRPVVNKVIEFLLTFDNLYISYRG